jgi:hypothetical protein
VVPHLGSTTVPSHPTLYRHVELMGKENGYNSSHVYCQAKRWSKKSYENFLNDMENIFEMVRWRGTKWHHIKRVFEVEVFSSQNIDFPFISRDSWSFSLSFFSILFRPLSLSLFIFLYAPSLEDLGVLMI